MRQGVWIFVHPQLYRSSRLAMTQLNTPLIGSLASIHVVVFLMFAKVPLRLLLTCRVVCSFR